jgi:hypothetical protein
MLVLIMWISLSTMIRAFLEAQSASIVVIVLLLGLVDPFGFRIRAIPEGIAAQVVSRLGASEAGAPAGFGKPHGGVLGGSPAFGSSRALRYAPVGAEVTAVGYGRKKSPAEAGRRMGDAGYVSGAEFHRRLQSLLPLASPLVGG